MRTIAPAVAIALLCLGGLAAPAWSQAKPPSILPSNPPPASVPEAPLEIPPEVPGGAGSGGSGAPGVPQPPPPPSAEARAAAKALTDVLGLDRQAQGMVQAMRSEIIQVVMRGAGKTPEEAIKVVDEVFMPDFAAQQSSLMGALIDVWARAFSVQELTELKSFYVTPLGQKLIAAMPGVNQQALATGQAWGRAIYQDSAKKHATELSKRGVRL